MIPPLLLRVSNSFVPPAGPKMPGPPAQAANASPNANAITGVPQKFFFAIVFSFTLATKFYELYVWFHKTFFFHQ
jgi:hypothetical protein